MKLKKILLLPLLLIFPLSTQLIFTGCSNQEGLKLTQSNFSENNLYKDIKKSFEEKNFEDVISKAEVYLKYFPYSKHAQDVYYMLAVSYKKFIFDPSFDPYFAKKLYDLSQKYLLLYPNGKYAKEFKKFRNYSKEVLFEHEYIIVKEEIKRDNYWAALDRLYNLCHKDMFLDLIERRKKEILKDFNSLKPKAIKQVKTMIKEREQKIKNYKEKIKENPEKKEIYENWIKLLENEIKYLDKQEKLIKGLSCF